MKKLILVSLLALLTFGCGAKEFDYEKEMETIGTSYYNDYMKGNGLDEAIISITDLKQANETMGEKYDLSKLSKCTDESNIKIILKSGTIQIDHYEFNLNCK